MSNTHSVLRNFLFLSILGLSALASAQGPQCRYARTANDVPGKPPFHRLTLTFDDGPNPDTTPQVLDILKKYQIKATFFLIGENIAGNEDLVRRELREGHNIGNHTFTHPHLSQLTPDQVHDEFQKTEDVLKQFARTQPLVTRFPYGDSSCVAEAEAERLGYSIVGWNDETCDWSYGEGLNSGDCIAQAAVRDRYRDDYNGYVDFRLSKHQGGIVLMHDAEPFTATHLEALIQHLIAEGYTFGTLYDGSYPAVIKP